MGDLNGTPIELAGAAAVEEEVSPVVGSRRCRISRPLLAPPTHRGQWGRGWRADIDLIRRKMRLSGWSGPSDAMVAHWVVEAPWSSEVVHSYSLIAVHLRFDFQHKPVTRYLEGATHEVALWAINPQAERGPLLSEPLNPGVWLHPAVFSSQFIASGDEAAAARLAHAVELVCAGRLSPHPTHVRSWAELFGDNMLRRARPPAHEESQ